MDINVFLVDLPPSVKGYTVANADGSFSIFINARCASNIQEQTYRHEREHVENGDFDRDLPVDIIELKAHGLSTCLEEIDIKTKYPNAYKYFKNKKRKRARSRKDENDRINFLTEHADLFRRAENHYLYGDDL